MKTAEIKPGISDGAKVVRVQSNETAQAALKLMKHNRIHHLVVFEADRYVGIVNDRELIHEEATPVGQIVKPTHPTIDEKSDVAEAVRLMVENNVDSLAVFKDGQLNGIVTMKDLMQVLHKFHSGSDVGNLVSQGEVMISSPFVQNVLNALSSLGV